jgi:hypothetical protein
MQDLEVRRLAPDGRAVVDDLDLDLPFSVIELNH